MNKNIAYAEITEQLAALLNGEHDIIANMANTSALLYQSLPDINWVGFYRKVNQELLLGPFQGKPACFRIPFNKGVCGSCFSRQELIRVDNVKEFPGHIACDCNSLSEIVLPIYHEGEIIAVLDIDAPILNRFDAEDESGLSAVVDILESSLNSPNYISLYK